MGNQRVARIGIPALIKGRPDRCPSMEQNHELRASVLARAKLFVSNSLIRKKTHSKVHPPQTNSSSLERGSSLPLLPRRRRAPLVQSGQPLHFSHKHFFDQVFVFVAHHALQSPSVGLGVGANVGAGVGAPPPSAPLGPNCAPICS